MEPTADPYYGSRFVYDAGRDGVWGPLCRYIGRLFPADGTILEIGAGYCSFINQVQAGEKHALDISAELKRFAAPSVKTHVGSCDNLSHLPAKHFDAVFASNLFEHLDDGLITRTLAEVKRVLKPGGRLILLQPNFRYAYREYFDDYTHVRVFTHVSLADMLTAAGFSVDKIEPRFLPISMKSRLPKWPWLVELYLALPYRPFAKQMLLSGRTAVGANT